MVQIQVIWKVNGTRSKILNEEKPTFDSKTDLERYRKELKKVYGCDIFFTYKEK